MNTNDSERRKQRFLVLVAELYDIYFAPVRESAASSPCLATLDEACVALKLSKPTIRKRVRAGIIPALQLGDSLRFDLPAVVAALKANSPATVKAEETIGVVRLERRKGAA